MDDQLKKDTGIVKKLIAEKDCAQAYRQLCRIALPMHDFTLQHQFKRMWAAIAKEDLYLKPLRLAIVPTSSAEHLVDILRFWLGKEGFDAEIYLGEFNTMAQTVLDPTSQLYQFKPDVVWFFSNSRNIAECPYGASQETIDGLLAQEVGQLSTLWDYVQENSSAYIIQNNADLPLERAFGNFESSVNWSRINFLRQFNVKLAQNKSAGMTILDMDYLSSVYGKKQWFDESYWFHSKHAFTLNALGLVASSAAKVISAIKGQAKKCLVLDLDNTLWGGVIGDDGLKGIKLGADADGEAFVDFQKYLCKLKSRGVVLAVCSKNDEEIAKEPFLKHPDMQLKLEDIAVFVANWDNKADNIRSIAETLNLGLDSLVFVDDNPAECELIRSLLPEVAVVGLPSDPAYFVRILDEKAHFETVNFSEEDQARSQMYRTNAERKELESQFTNLTDYLKNLQMKAIVSEFDTVHLPRIAQLINKSNQFHLTTTRYSEAQIQDMMRDKNTVCRYFKLKDKFGDNGLISVVIMKKQNTGELYIDTWLMSCRVLSRGMEEFVHNEILSIAQELNCQRILGQYIPTAKNKLVSEHYKKLNYAVIDESEKMTSYELRLNGNLPLKETFIEKTLAY